MLAIHVCVTAGSPAIEHAFILADPPWCAHACHLFCLLAEAGKLPLFFASYQRLHVLKAERRAAGLPSTSNQTSQDSGWRGFHIFLTCTHQILKVGMQHEGCRGDAQCAHSTDLCHTSFHEPIALNIHHPTLDITWRFDLGEQMVHGCAPGCGHCLPPGVPHTLCSALHNTF